MKKIELGREDGAWIVKSVLGFVSDGCKKVSITFIPVGFRDRDLAPFEVTVDYNPHDNLYQFIGEEVLSVNKAYESSKNVEIEFKPGGLTRTLTLSLNKASDSDEFEKMRSWTKWYIEKVSYVYVSETVSRIEITLTSNKEGFENPSLSINVANNGDSRAVGDRLGQEVSEMFYDSPSLGRFVIRFEDSDQYRDLYLYKVEL